MGIHAGVPQAGPGQAVLPSRSKPRGEQVDADMGSRQEGVSHCGPPEDQDEQLRQIHDAGNA